MYKNLKVKTSDGYTIKTWFLPAQELLSVKEIATFRFSKKKRKYELKDSEPKPTIIMCDGDAGNMSRSVFDNLTGDKELWVVKEAAHGGCHAPEVVERKKFIEKSSIFFKRCL
ncbi:MAG: hypothetical protein WBG43_05180 [Marinifilaceae bacterium]